MTDVEEKLKRISAHKGVVGTIVMDVDAIPVRTTLDNSTTVQYCQLYMPLIRMARGCVRDIDPTNDLAFLRLRTKKHEIMIAPEKDYLFIVIQNPSEA